MLTLDDELELGRRVQDGDLEARNILIEANMKLVNGLWKRYERPGRAEDDIKQDGYLGLLRAVDTYDPTLGLRFSTYATYQVKDCMKNGMCNHSHTVRLPYDIIKKHTKLKKFKSRFYNEHGVEPTYAEITEGIGFDKKTQKHIMCVYQAVIGTNHLEGEAELLDELDDGFEVDLTDVYKVKKVVDRLPHNQNQVIVRTFGLHHGQPETSENIALRLGCTKETVLRLKKTALDHVQALLAII